MPNTTDNKQVPSLAGKYLTFGLGKEDYAMSVRNVKEIVTVLPVTRVPGMPPHVLGVLNLRGKVIPLVDLAMKMGVSPTETGDRPAIVVAQIGTSGLCGLLVTRVGEVLAIAAADIDLPSGGAHDAGIVGLARVRDQITILVDIPTALSDMAMAGGALGV